MDLRLFYLSLLISGYYSQDVNRPPVFSPSPSSFDVNENEIGNVLTTLRATDPDNDPIRFSIDINDYFNIRVVNSNTVDVISTRGIDYERNTRYVEFKVTATDENSSSMTTKEISVNVRDINDNAPVFAQGGSSSFVIAEAAEVGYRIADAFRVLDADTGANAETTITCFVDHTSEQSQEACNTFELEASRVSNGNYSVDIILKESLDFESVQSYIMTVDAVNTAPPANFTRKNFVINVLDSQDQLPVFLRAPYSPVPWEEIALGSVIDEISVRDGDREAQPPRNMRLQLLNDTRGWLSLSSLQNIDGVFISNLTVRSRMDREEYHNQPLYVVAVRVTELFADGTPDESATATTSITLQIYDINDNAPEFYTGNGALQRLTGPLILEVEEGLGVNTNLPGFLLSIVDIDIPPNNQFSIHMEGFGNDTFQLLPLYGTGSLVPSLTVKKEANLDYEKPKYRHMELTIIARDSLGIENLTRAATVIINLKDKNDNSPHFEQGIYTRRVSSEVSPGSVILTVNATDPDSGEFGSVTYSIRDSANLIRINSDTGTVYLVSHPAAGSPTRYEFELEVTDGGGLSTTSLLVINFVNEFPQGPRFDTHIYNASVYENRTRFIEEPVRVRATDEDSPLITYNIISGNTPDNVFLLHPTSGLLTLRRPLLKEDGQQFELTIEATDGELNDTAHIAVTLLDFNDYTPQFLVRNYFKTIPESTPVGTNVLNVTATDQDGADENGGKLTYTITSGDNSQRFYLNFDNGELNVNAELDYDTQNNFVLQVKAEDGGVPSKSAFATVNIVLTDINNRLPRFFNDPYVQYMSETAPVGSKVLVVNAFDLDRGSLLRYNIVSGSFEARDPFGREVAGAAEFDFRNAFVIDEISGEITTRLTFNRDVVSYISFRVRVVDVNGEDPRLQQGFASVQVTIREDGVGIPLFLNEPWTYSDQRIVVNVTEERQGLILQLIAVDSISGAPVTTYREVAGDPDNIITIKINGEVYLNQKLDYEQLFNPIKRIVVEAITSGGQASTATLQINILDVNDNAPTFVQEPYSFSLVERLYVNRHLLGVVAATDSDTNTVLTYTLSGRYSEIFYIDDQGKIYLRNNTLVDSEDVGEYYLYVQVSDGVHFSSVPVVVTITNKNEYPPVCVHPQSTLFVPKSTAAGVSFGQVSATDDDIGDEVHYFTTSEMFAVDQLTGAISTIRPLSTSRFSTYNFTIRARDSIAPYRETACQVIVIVTSKETSNNPIFVTPAREGDTYYVEEESSAGTSVVRIRVEYADGSLVDGVVYSLANITDSRYFRIDPENGQIYVNVVLDRETQPQYELIVIARNNRTEVSRKFYVSLTDIDDNGPSFDCNDLAYPLRIEVIEQQAGGEKIIGRIKACDEDEPPNNRIFYHIVECADGTSTDQTGRFSIDAETGNISVDPMTIDYEISTLHVICINASTSRTNASIRSQQWKVHIVVKNRDDYNLKFDKNEISIVMSGSIGIGVDIVRIYARETVYLVGDSIRYEIISTEYIRGSLVVRGGDNSTIRNAFAIEATTGKITTNLPSYLDLIGGRFIIKIRAKTSTDSAEVTLMVFVNNPSDQLVLVIDQSPEEVNKFIRGFFDELEDIHGYKFFIQKIENHTDINTQQTDLNMTDVYFYVLDKDGNLISASEIAPILKAAYSNRQAELFRRYGVVDGNPQTSRQVDRVSIVSWEDLEWIWWIIIICAIVLFIDGVILLGCLLYFYNKYVKSPSKRPPQAVYVR